MLPQATDAEGDEESEEEESEEEEAGDADNEWDMSVDVGVDMGDGMCTVALDDLPDADITAALFNLEERKKEWRLKGRALCTKQVCVDSEGVVNWLSNVQASAKFMHRQVLGPETTEDDEGGLVEVEGMVKQVVFGHRSTDVAVCYVEFEAIGTHKLLTVEDVVQGNLSLHPLSSCINYHQHVLMSLGFWVVQQVHYYCLSCCVCFNMLHYWRL